GADITMVSWSAMVHQCLAAAEMLDEDEIEAEVIDLRTLLPWDSAAVLQSVSKTNRLMIVQEAPRTGGFAGEIAATVAEQAVDSLDAPIVRVTSVDAHVPFSPPLEKFYLPNVADIVESAKKLVKY